MSVSSSLSAVAWKQSPPLLAVSAAGWLVMAILDPSAVAPDLCSSSVAAATFYDSAVATLSIRPPMAILASWIVMLLATMPPLLAQPMRHLWVRSLTRRRWRSIAIFVAGYGAIWMLAGLALAAMAIALAFSERSTGIPAIAAAICLLAFWQVAPARQASLNRCHRLPRLTAFGLTADADALRYGLTHGVWCVGACWALMLLPLVAGAAHVVVMTAVTLALLIERARPAKPARWRLASQSWVLRLLAPGHSTVRTAP
jgi:predicted metal-binding membrane protein